MPPSHSNTDQHSGTEVADPSASARTGRLSSITKALDLLELLAAAPREWGVSELGRELSLSKSVVHGLLATLRDKDFVAMDERSRRYRLGLKALTLGAHHDLDQMLRAASMPVLNQLTATSGEASYLMVRRGLSCVAVARSLPATAIHLAIEEGVRTPLHAGASARVILAHEPPDLVDAVIRQSGLPRLGACTITEADALLDSLEQIRRQGHAFSVSETLNGVFALAAPVHGAGQLIGSLGLVGIEASLGDRKPRLLAQLLDHARQLSGVLSSRSDAVG